MSTLEQNLERRLAQHGEDDFVVKQLRRQIAAKNSGQSAQDLYVTGAVSEQAKPKRVSKYRASEEEQRQFAKLYNDDLVITMTPPKVISSEEEDPK